MRAGAQRWCRSLPRRLGFAHVVYRPLQDAAGLHAELHLAWRREGRHPVAARVREVLQQQAFHTS